MDEDHLHKKWWKKFIATLIINYPRIWKSKSCRSHKSTHKSQDPWAFLPKILCHTQYLKSKQLKKRLPNLPSISMSFIYIFLFQFSTYSSISLLTKSSSWLSEIFSKILTFLNHWMNTRSLTLSSTNSFAITSIISLSSFLFKRLGINQCRKKKVGYYTFVPKKLW